MKLEALQTFKAALDKIEEECKDDEEKKNIILQDMKNFCEERILSLNPKKSWFDGKPAKHLKNAEKLDAKYFDKDTLRYAVIPADEIVDRVLAAYQNFAEHCGEPDYAKRAELIKKYITPAPVPAPG